MLAGNANAVELQFGSDSAALAQASSTHPITSDATPPEKKHVLILFGLGSGAPAFNSVLTGFNASFAKENILTDNVEREILDITSPKYPQQRHDVHEMLARKYAGKKFDLVITVFSAGLDFISKEGADLFPGTPVVSILAEGLPQSQLADQRIVQSPVNYDLTGTLKRALEIFPDTKRVVFVTGTSTENKINERRAREAFIPWQGRLAFEYTSHLPLSDMLKHVAALPPNTIIFYALFTADVTGQTFIPRDIALRISRVSNVPIFSYATTMQNAGVVGGMMLDINAYGNMFGRAVAAFIRGQPIAIEPTKAYIKPTFDWNQIQRWKIDTDRLPENSIFINRPPTLWSEYQREVRGALVVFIMLILSLALLAAENRRRRKAEQLAHDGTAALRILKGQSETHLREQVMERTRELHEEMRHRAEVERQAQEEQRQFIAMVSHEFRTPLAIISATTERLAEKHAVTDTQSHAGYAKIQKSLDWLTSLLDEYLTEERLVLLGKGLNIKPASPAELLHNAAIKASAISPRHIINVATTTLPQSFALDAGLMELALHILIENAVKHTTPDTIISVKGEETARGGICIKVADNGPGIPQDELVLVFQKFFRGRQSGTTYGSGLGLYLARNVVTLHGGSLVAQNRLEGGAEFTLCLPPSKP